MEKIMRNNLKIAGWWGSGPLGGDPALDILDTIRREGSPEEAAAYLKKELSGRWSSDRYGALGVYYLIMTTAPEEYKEAVSGLSSLTEKVAKEIAADEEWMEEWYGEKYTVDEWLYFFERGMKGSPPAELGYNGDFLEDDGKTAAPKAIRFNGSVYHKLLKKKK